MTLFFSLFWFLLNTKFTKAQSQSLVYLLQSSYRPISSQTSLEIYPTSTPNPTPTATFTPAPSKQVTIDTKTAQIPTPEPAQIGGEGQVVNLALLGDSMIDTLGTNPQSLISMLKSYYPTVKFNIYNYGVGSKTIEDGLNYLSVPLKYKDRNYPSLLELQPDILVVESFAYNNFGNTQEGFNRHWQALVKITDTVKKKLPLTKLIFTNTLAPNSVVFANGSGINYTALEKLERTKTITLYLQRTASFSKAVNLPLANVYEKSLLNGDGQTSLIDTKDHIHPNSTGADFFSAILAKTIWDNHQVDLQE